MVTVSRSLNGSRRPAAFTIDRTTIALVSVNRTAVEGCRVAMPSFVFVPAGSNQVTITVGTRDVDTDQTKEVGISYDSFPWYTALTLLD